MNDMTETRTLLARYVEDGSEPAFRQLVESYIDLVYSTALRLVEEDSHRAEDVSQMVFVRLAQKARSLPGNVSLGGWLHRDTCHVAATLMRGERRRQVRERLAVEMNALEDDSHLDSVLPVLDEAIDQLPDQDREAIILRFFEQQNFRALAEAVGGTEDAARMRVNRALDKLHGLLKSRGVALSIAGLATLLGAKAVAAAPVGLAASVVSGAAGSLAGTTGSVLAKGWKLFLMPAAALLLTIGIGTQLVNRVARKANEPSPIKTAAITTAPDVGQLSALPTNPSPATSTTAPTGMRFQAVEAGTELPLAGAKVHIAYFRDGGEGKSVEMQTDAHGSAQIEFMQPPYTAVNFFVAAAGHVPLVTSWREGDMPTNYVMRLPLGTAVGGTIVDQAQQPIADASIEFSVPGGMDRARKENIQYYNAGQKTDANGRWFSDMMPADYEKMGVFVTHPDFAVLSTQMVINVRSSTESRLAMKPGTLVAGIVTDTAGKPVAGAKVSEIHNRGDLQRSTATDAAGRFVFPHMNDGDLDLSVQAQGFAAVSLDLVISNGFPELKVPLGPGKIFRGHIVNDNGSPISNAIAKTDSDSQGLRHFEWSVRTDEQGRFEWDSAPAESVGYWFEAPGYSAIREQMLKADGSDHEIRLTRSESPAGTPRVKIAGSVLDEDTGQPLDDFRVMISDERHPQLPAEFSYGTDGKGGAFELHARSLSGMYQIQIQKDGYAPAMSTNLYIKDGDQTLAFSLHKDAGIRGVVLLPDGKAATDATVFVYELQGGVYMDQPGTFRREVSTKLNVRTDNQGKFSFGNTLQAQGLIAIHDQGYADIPLRDFKGKIPLQAWGRIEGKLLVGGDPGEGKTISLQNNWHPHVLAPNERSSSPLMLYLTATTGPDGTFILEKVPPGEHWICENLPLPKAGAGRIYETEGHPVDVAPGTVTFVQLGGSGQRITGRATFSGTTSVPWKNLPVQLILNVPAGPTNYPVPTAFPSTDAFREAAKAYSETQRAFWNSDAGRAIDRSRRRYSTFCADDGSFSIPDVPSGAYELRIEIPERVRANLTDYDVKMAGQLHLPINVPETSGNEHPVLDLGTVPVPEVQGVRAPLL
jgi:RNA polymerase sigma factor (sigma-70 family)